MKILRIFLSILLIFSIFTLTACPKAEKTIRTFREQSAKMSIYGGKLIDANKDAFQAKEISKELFAGLTDLSGKFRDGLKIYRDSVNDAEIAYKSAGKLPPGVLGKLQVLFNEKVVEAFSNLALKLELVTGTQSETIKSIVASIRLTILAIQGAFSIAKIHLNEVPA